MDAETGKRADTPGAHGVPEAYERILVALDGSEAAEKVLPYVQVLAGRFGSTVILLRAVPPPDAALASTAAAPLVPPIPAPAYDLTAVIEAEAEQAAQYLRAVAERLEAAGVRVQVEQPEGRPAEVIIERARALGVGLIAMTTHGRSGLARAVLGSVADEVVRRSTCPVLLMRSVQQEQ